jgi:hypothetical protein
MASTTTPTYTAGAAGNIHTSASLGAGATANDNYDGSAVFETQVHVLNTPGGSVAATRGVKVEVFRRYGTTPTLGESAMLTYTLPSTTASTAESLDFFLPTGKYNIKITNLDGTNAVTVEITGDVISNVATA